MWCLSKRSCLLFVRLCFLQPSIPAKTPLVSLPRCQLFEAVIWQRDCGGNPCTCMTAARVVQALRPSNGRRVTAAARYFCIRTKNRLVVFFSDFALSCV